LKCIEEAISTLDDEDAGDDGSTGQSPAFNPFDVTKVLVKKTIPLIEIGVLS
jgi:hypothetical protein